MKKSLCIILISSLLVFSFCNQAEKLRQEKVKQDSIIKALKFKAKKDSIKKDSIVKADKVKAELLKDNPVPGDWISGMGVAKSVFGDNRVKVKYQLYDNGYIKCIYVKDNKRWLKATVHRGDYYISTQYKYVEGTYIQRMREDDWKAYGYMSGKNRWSCSSEYGEKYYIQ